MISLLFEFELAGFLGGLRSRIQNAEDVVFAHDHVLSAIQLGVAAGVLPKEDAVAGFDAEGSQCAILEPLAVTDGNDFALLRFLLGGIWNDDAVARGFLL